MELGELAHGLFVECLCRRCLVEIQIATEYLIGALAREYHLDAHRLDDTCQQVHRSGGSHCGDIVGLDEVYHIAYGIQALLHGVVDLMVHGADMVGYETSLGKVRSTLQTDCKGVETRPVGFGLAIILDAHLTVFLGNS